MSHAVAKALDEFLHALLDGAAAVAQQRGAKTLSSSHLYVIWLCCMEWEVRGRFFGISPWPTCGLQSSFACCSKAHITAHPLLDFCLEAVKNVPDLPSFDGSVEAPKLVKKRTRYEE